jgi:hypothetical protein
MKRKKNTSLRIISLILSLILVFVSIPFAAFADESKNISNLFADEALREYILEFVDTNNDGYLSDEECNAVTSIDISSVGVYSVKGLEVFTNLETLICNDNFITEIALPELKNLKYLYADSNYIQLFNIGQQLEVLHIRNNYGAENIEFSKNWPNLRDLDCSYSNLATYSFSKILDNTKLEKLDCEGIGLTQLDVSKMQNLTELRCGGNALVALDLSQNPNLKVVDCKDNKFNITVDGSYYWQIWQLVNNGFSFDKATDWQGAEATNIYQWGTGSYYLCNINPTGFDYEITYTYDLGNGMSETFTLTYAVGGVSSGAELTGYSVSLDGNIRVNFDVILSDEIANSDTAYMHFTFSDGLTSDVYVRDLEPVEINGTLQYVFPCNVPAKEMVCDITGQIIDGDKVSGTFTYTVRDYSETILDNPKLLQSYIQAKEVVKSMLNYGAYAQLYFNHNASDLAHETKYISHAEKRKIHEVTAETLQQYQMDDLQSNGVFTFSGSNLSLKSKVVMRLYFKISDEADLDKLQFKCNDEVLTYGKSGSLYYVDINNISPEDLDEVYTVNISDGNYSLDVDYSVMAYCYMVLTRSNNENLKNAVKAIYLYNQEANLYFE